MRKSSILTSVMRSLSNQSKSISHNSSLKTNLDKKNKKYTQNISKLTFLDLITNQSRINRKIIQIKNLSRQHLQKKSHNQAHQSMKMNSGFPTRSLITIKHLNTFRQAVIMLTSQTNLIHQPLKKKRFKAMIRIH